MQRRIPPLIGNVGSMKAVSAKYKDKYIIVEGEILKKDVKPGAYALIYLKGTSQTKVRCQFSTDQDQAEPLMVGQKVKVVGHWGTDNESAQDTGEVKLDYCRVITGAK